MGTKSLVMVAAVMVSLGGCEAVLMTTPSAVTYGKINPFRDVVPRYQNSEAPIFVASGRTVSGRTSPADFYTTDRSRMVRVGLATGMRRVWIAGRVIASLKPSTSNSH